MFHERKVFIHSSVGLLRKRTELHSTSLHPFTSECDCNQILKSIYLATHIPRSNYRQPVVSPLLLLFKPLLYLIPSSPLSIAVRPQFYFHYQTPVDLNNHVTFLPYHHSEMFPIKIFQKYLFFFCSRICVIIH